MKKKIFGLAFTMLLSFLSITAAMAGQWQSDTTGWWWQNDDGTYPVNTWQWLDGNNDGTAECYYFNDKGYMLSDTTTPDGYNVNSDGAWVQDGTVQTQEVNKSTSENKPIYGSFECHDGYLDAVIDIGVYSDSGMDYINMSGATSDGRGMAEFSGTIIRSEDGNYIASNEFGELVMFSYDGENTVNVLYSKVSGGMFFYGFEGIYTRTADIDFSMVG